MAARGSAKFSAPGVCGNFYLSHQIIRNHRNSNKTNKADRFYQSQNAGTPPAPLVAQPSGGAAGNFPTSADLKSAANGPDVVPAISTSHTELLETLVTQTKETAAIIPTSHKIKLCRDNN
jgi:hypothetical protein